MAGGKSRKRAVIAVVVALVVIVVAVAACSASGSDGSGQAGQDTSTATETADKSTLKSSIDLVADAQASDYTPESFAALSSALSAARDVYADGSATQDEVNSALHDLSLATGDLVEVFDPADYEAITYDQLAANVGGYASKKVSVSGVVTDIRSFPDGSVGIYLATGTDGVSGQVYGFWDVSYGASAPAIGQSVTIYGRGNGWLDNTVDGTPQVLVESIA